MEVCGGESWCKEAGGCELGRGGKRLVWGGWKRCLFEKEGKAVFVFTRRLRCVQACC